MESWVGKLAESYFNEHREQAFAPNAEFLTYYQNKDVRNVSIAELSYQVAFGSIRYRCGETKYMYKNLLVKYFEGTASEHGLLRGFIPFNRELTFFRTVLPTFDGLAPTSHLFLKLYTSCFSATPASNRNVILFEWPDRAVHSVYVQIGFLSRPRCVLMVKRIAQFHSRSLHLRKMHPDRFEAMNLANPQPVHFNIDLVRPTLDRSLQRLAQDPQFSSLYQESMPRLVQILDTLECSLKKPFSRSHVNNHCWVMCHQNYGQENVIFLSSRNNKSADDLKMFNCQSMGFASLGVDLVIPLFVELEGRIRDRRFSELVHEYLYELLLRTDDDPQFVGLCVECIEKEIENSVPFALYHLASRIVQAEEPPSRNSLFEADVWKEELIINLYKYLIVNKFV